MGDMTGGSFTISNSGLWGSLFGTPIINVPQTAVLGTYGIQDRPVAINGQVGIRPVSIIQSPFISCSPLIILPMPDDVHCSDLRSPPR
jgi:pyruvate/2-oxoglutarate dehydrogenase complex dihydrolipoamide acyltransferase (E2) component